MVYNQIIKTKNGHKSGEEKAMKQQWTLTYNDLMRLILALRSHIRETQAEGIPNCSSAEIEEDIAESNALAYRLKEIQDAFRKDKEDEDDITSPWMERDLALITIRPKPGDEPYTVMKWGEEWAVVDKENPVRPVGEHLYDHSTHAHRKKRELNKAARMATWPMDDYYRQLEEEKERDYNHDPYDGLS
jgi:hypothetical protein